MITTIRNTLKIKFADGFPMTYSGNFNPDSRLHGFRKRDRLQSLTPPGPFHSTNDSEGKTGEVFIKTDADNILEDCLYHDIRDGIAKRKLLVLTEKTKDPFSFVSDRIIVVNDPENASTPI